MLRRSLLVLPLLIAALAACTEEERDAEGPVIARVDGEAIRAADLTRALERGGMGQLPQEMQRRVLEELIEHRLLLAAAKARQIRVEEAEVERAFARLEADYPAEQFGRLLEAEGIAPAALKRELRESLLLQRLFLDEVVARVAVTDEEVAVWLEAHGDELSRPEQVRAAQIVVKTEEEAEAIRAKLTKGEPFEELAREASLSPDGKNGGDLGFFARGEMPPPFDEVCFELAPGRISDVVASPYGFHVFKVLERRKASEPDDEEKRAEAERQLRRAKEAAAQRAFLARLRAAAQIDVDEAALVRQLGNP